MRTSILTPEQIVIIDEMAMQVARHGWGSLTIDIEKGRVRWLKASLSHDITAPAGNSSAPGPPEELGKSRS